MKKLMYTAIAALFFVTACKQNQPEKTATKNTAAVPVNKQPATNEPNELPGTDCIPLEKLVFEEAGFAAYTEDIIRGEGIISFTMDINDRLEIFNTDGSVFGEIVLNEDMTYFTVNMPQKIVARKVIANFDFAAFDFDAENINSDNEYLMIYINKEKRKVKKTGLKFTYNKWNEYLKNNTIAFKDCNVLKDETGKQLAMATNQLYTIIEINGDMINIKSSKECTPDGITYRNIQQWVKWKSGNILTIDFVACN